MSISFCQSVPRLATQTFFAKMFKLVVLSALVAVAVAKPSGLAHSALAYSSPLVEVVPGAVSHSYRSDVISKPVVAAYAAPAVVAAPVVQKVLAVPAAVSHSYRSDVISKPVVAAYAAPIVEKIVAPVAVPAAVSHSFRSDVISKPLVAAYSAPAVVSSHLAYAAHVPAVHAW
nr:cuticle protein 38-like [Leptinotarsa decemlineata]